MNNLRIEFSIFGDIIIFEDLNTICDTLPTKCHKKGDKLNYATAKEDSWNLVYISSENEEIESLIWPLIQKLGNRATLIRRYCTKNNLQVKLFICFRINKKYVPSIYFSKKTIQFFNKIGLEVDFDLYFE